MKEAYKYQMSEPLISVIVPVYNVENYIARCVGSICAQTYTNLEILLVDDGSTDSSGAFCDEFAGKDARVRTIHKENGGLSDARNAGMRAASGKYFAFVDSDDYIAEDYIEYLYQMIEKYHAQIAVCGYRKVYHSEEKTKNSICDLTEVCKEKQQDQLNRNNDIATINNSRYRIKAENNNSIDSEKVYNTEEGLYHLLYQKGMISSAWGRLFDTALFLLHPSAEESAFSRSLGIFFPVGKLHEDVAVMYKLFAAADTIVCGDEEKYYYFQRPDSIVNQQFDRRRMDYITFTSECIHFMKHYNPGLYKAAVSRHFSACFELLSCIEKKGCYKKEYGQLVKEIRKYRSMVLWDRNARWKNRFAAAGTYVSLGLIYRLSRIGYYTGGRKD